MQTTAERDSARTGEAVLMGGSDGPSAQGTAALGGAELEAEVQADTGLLLESVAAGRLATGGAGEEPLYAGPVQGSGKVPQAVAPTEAGPKAA